MSTIRPYPSTLSEYRTRIRSSQREDNWENQPPLPPTPPPVRGLGLAGGAALGALAGSQGHAAGALFGGATGLVGGFATGYLAGSTIARECGGNRVIRRFAGLAVGVSTATLTYPGATLLAATASSPAITVALAVVGGVGGYLLAQQWSR